MDHRTTASAEQRADSERDYRKHEWRPGDPAPLEQRLAVAQLIGYCEGVAKSGVLADTCKLQLRKLIAEALVAFNMPPNRELV